MTLLQTSNFNVLLFWLNRILELVWPKWSQPRLKIVLWLKHIMHFALFCPTVILTCNSICRWTILSFQCVHACLIPRVHRWLYFGLKKSFLLFCDHPVGGSHNRNIYLTWNVRTIFSQLNCFHPKWQLWHSTDEQGLANWTWQSEVVITQWNILWCDCIISLFSRVFDSACVLEHALDS